MTGSATVNPKSIAWFAVFSVYSLSPPINLLIHLHRGAVPCRSAAATHISPSCPDLPSRVFSEVWRCVRSGGRGRRNTWPACKSNGFWGGDVRRNGQGVARVWKTVHIAYQVMSGVPLTTQKSITVTAPFLNSSGSRRKCPIHFLSWFFVKSLYKEF